MIGAGAVGLEFASTLPVVRRRRHGARGPARVSRRWRTRTVSKEVARAFRKRGIATAVGASVTSIVDDGTGATVTYQVGDAPDERDAPTSAWSRSAGAR